MKNTIFSLVSLTIFTHYSIGMEHSFIEIRKEIESKAKIFGEQRANPISYAGNWEQAYIAYALSLLKQGTPIKDVLNLCQVKERCFKSTSNRAKEIYCVSQIRRRTTHAIFSKSM